MMENMGYGQQKRSKDIVEKEAAEEEPAAGKEEEEAEEQQQDDDEPYDTVAKIKLACKGKRIKEFRVTGNLNRPNTSMVLASITPHIEMRVKVILNQWSIGVVMKSSLTARQIQHQACLQV